MMLLLILIEFFLAAACVGLFLYLSSKKGKQYMDWLILVMVFFAVIKLAKAFLVLNEIQNVDDVMATLDMGFATAFTAFVFLRSREVGLV